MVDGEGYTLGSPTSVTIVIRNDDVAANRPPIFGESATIRHLAENKPGGSKVGPQITAVDPDGDPLAYSLSGEDADAFEVHPVVGRLLTRDGITYDFETRPIYRVVVTAADGKGGEASIEVTIQLLDVDEPLDLTGTNDDDVLEGGRGDDTLRGKKGDDVLRGLGGNDLLLGGGGNDTLDGGLGDDELRGWMGDDTYTGGPGNDRFVFSAWESGDKIITDFGAGDLIVLTTDLQAAPWPPVADILASVAAQGDRYTVYALREGLTVETHVPLRTEDFALE